MSLLSCSVVACPALCVLLRTADCIIVRRTRLRLRSSALIVVIPVVADLFASLHIVHHAGILLRRGFHRVDSQWSIRKNDRIMVQLFIALDGCRILFGVAVGESVLLVDNQVGGVPFPIAFGSLDGLFGISSHNVQVSEFGRSQIIIRIFILNDFIATDSR